MSQSGLNQDPMSSDTLQRSAAVLSRQHMSSVEYHWCSHTLFQRAASRTDIHTRCRVCPGLRGITARGEPARGNKHLSCAN
ncbi:hypothetical protein NQZ68_000907 [Dissostichus eleginoides]|nr:hypothetical protein NQZ68_000907 [Dissostichus eleginoides]